jgi:hypothetical protein
MFTSAVGFGKHHLLIYQPRGSDVYRSQRFINPLEVMFTSAVGFGKHHFLGVDKSQCPPYEKSLIV